MKLTSKTLCRILCGCIACLLLVAVMPIQTSAAVPYESYTYNSREQAVPTATPYVVSQVISGTSLGIGHELSAKDIYVTEENEVYILNHTQSEIIILDANLQMKGNPITLYDEYDMKIDFSDATGLFVYDVQVVDEENPDAEPTTERRIVVCGTVGFTPNKSVTMFDLNGKWIGTIDRPVSAVIDEKFIYAPLKAAVDSGGIMYILNENSSEGALQFDKNGDFMGFYGGESVDLTFDVLMRHFWKGILSDEAAEGVGDNVSVTFDSFCIDEKDFIFTIRVGHQTTTGQVRKLNAKGANVLDEEKRFGDHIEEILLKDIIVDDDGFITVIDGKNGHVMQYDPDGEMLYAFGGIGQQVGMFTSPVAVESLGDKILVLDNAAKSITVFQPTDFATNVRAATLLYRDGKYEEAKEPWTQVLAMDNNYELANNGMGKIHEGLGNSFMNENKVAEGMNEYKTAMEYYKRGNNKKFYSDAFEEYRGAILRQYFGIFMIVIAAAFIVPLVLMSRKPKVKEVYAGGRPKSKYPFYCMFHPMNGYDDLKAENSGSFWRANCILAALFVVSVLTHQLTGFAYNNNRVEQLNIWVTLCSTIGVFVAFVVCNWAVTTIMDGKGKLMEIWVFMAYAMLPYVLFSAAMIVCSNVLTIDESAFYAAVQWVGYLWTALSIVVALREVHMYTLKKTFGTLLITIAGLVIVVVLVAILYSVFSQLIGFGTTVWSEITTRT